MSIESLVTSYLFIWSLGVLFLLLSLCLRNTNFNTGVSFGLYIAGSVLLVYLSLFAKSGYVMFSITLVLLIGIVIRYLLHRYVYKTTRITTLTIEGTKLDGSIVVETPRIKAGGVTSRNGNVYINDTAVDLEDLTADGDIVIKTSKGN